jgi:hypothetical protein
MAFDPRQLYELHITVNIREHDLAEVVAKELHWKMSQIMGDPVLGHKPFSYLTTYSDDIDSALGKLDRCVIALREAGVAVIREKIEHIVHDVRH